METTRANGLSHWQGLRPAFERAFYCFGRMISDGEMVPRRHLTNVHLRP